MTKAIIFDCLGVLGPDLIPLLRNLKRHYRLAVLSNYNRADLDDYLNRYDLRPYFDVVLASSQTRYTKPQYQIFEIMVGRLDLPLSQLLFIDDSSINTAAAQNFGITAITYKDPRQLTAELDRLGLKTL